MMCIFQFLKQTTMLTVSGERDDHCFLTMYSDELKSHFIYFLMFFSNVTLMEFYQVNFFNRSDF